MSNPYSRQLANLKVDPNEAGMFAGYDLIANNTTIPDVLATNNGIITPHFESAYGPLGRFIRFNGSDSYIDFGTGFNSLSAVTVSFWANMPDTSTSQYLINKYLSTSDAWGLRVASNQLQINDDIDNADALLYSTTVQPNVWYYIVVVLTSIYENKLYVNGQLKGSGTLSSAGWDSYAGNLYLATRNTAVGLAKTKFTKLQIFGDEKSVDWVKQQYDEGKKSLWHTSYGADISVSAVTGGNIENTPFRVESGSHQISSYSVNGLAAKAIECVTAGNISLVSGHYHPENSDTAFGDYECWIEKASGHTTKIGFINQDRNNAANGYGIQITTDGTTTIEEWGVGSVVTGGSLTPGTLTKINLKRDTLGDVFEGFIDNISFGTGSDSTIVKSYYTVFELGVGDKIVYADLNGGHAITKRLMA